MKKINNERSLRILLQIHLDEKAKKEKERWDEYCEKLKNNNEARKNLSMSLGSDENIKSDTQANFFMNKFKEIYESLKEF